ncbi:ATP-dependent endonuclease [Streptomyces sp. S07_1.15]|uniref:ATP-dependent nuclease n=1 Tax=Streptomyces sp. S07_1.15 TaxID=2873925 RepID=UPI001D13E661|nr:ATP-dependent endonuclease [Streptomyces sp. S07_1.15]MCC3653397.1 ATP-dependent endonuclease [Streptomyces sp. S07_1.15]
MRMIRARIENFRCLQEAEVRFDGVTSIIGPNGVGKSTILRALDWFFNGEKGTSLSTDDLCVDTQSSRIRVEVEFDSLTIRDREELGHYAPEGVESIVIWRTWDNGEDRITGKGLTFPPFEVVRSQQNATAKRRAYNSLREERPGLGLPAAGSEALVEEAMIVWERNHPEELMESDIQATNFFGFAGKGKLANLFEFILVSADLRALEESTDMRSTIFGRIIERAVDRKIADAELAELDNRLNVERARIATKNFGPQLDLISKELTKAVEVFSAGRNVLVSPVENPYKPVKASFKVSILDGPVETGVERQGHGFQRAMIIAALKLLSDRGSDGPRSRAVCLAIEEPELYQHPVQARAFSQVLRKIAEDPNQMAQVAYATHNPIFVDPHHFHEVRRISRVRGGTSERALSIAHVRVEDVVESLSGFVPEERVKKQIGASILHRLAEALFASAVILVEGDTDKAVLEGCAARDGAPLAVEGIHVAEAGSKTAIYLSRAILSLLGIPCFVVFDADSGVGIRMERKGRKESDIHDAECKERTENRRLFLYLGHPSKSEWPQTHAESEFAVFADRLEESLNEYWPEWGQKVDELIESGLGYSEKNSYTYERAAFEAEGEPPIVIKQIIENAKSIARQGQ